MIFLYANYWCFLLYFFDIINDNFVKMTEKNALQYAEHFDGILVLNLSVHRLLILVKHINDFLCGLFVKLCYNDGCYHTADESGDDLIQSCRA